MTRKHRQPRDTGEIILGRRLWRERVLAGLSPDELGSAAGISGAAIGEYERGEDRMSAPELALVARRLGVPLAFFCAVEEEPAAPPKSVTAEPVVRLAVRRPLSLLATPGFAAARPLFELWRRRGGKLTDEVLRAVRASGLAHRAILVRNPAGSSRLVTQHFGAGIMIMRPCEALLTLERDFDQHHGDRAYTAWVAEAYAETLWHRRPRLESIRVRVQMGAATTLTGRYDRLIMPWRSERNDCFAMALSIQRAAPVLSS